MADSSNDRDLLESTGEIFDRLVHEVTDDAWDAQTPCSDWGVRDLVNHLVAEHLWVPHLLDGESVDEVGDRYEGDVVGDDPVGAWEDAWAASREAWAALTDDEQAVHLSRGPTPASAYRVEMIFDLVVHAWDLARGAGLDYRADPRGVDRSLEVAEANAGWSGTSMFDEPVDADSDDPLLRLVALTGRRP